MNHWSPPERPAVYAEHTLIAAILDGRYPAGAALPAERELSVQLGVTRPTLRETLQRLERDGWLTIQQGKPTRVNDFWRQGGLNVLSALVHNGQGLPANFVPNLLQVRLVMAPAYARLAVADRPAAVLECLAEAATLADSPAAYANFDWRLHHALTIASGNPIFTLILNGFAGFYEQIAVRYFAAAQARRASQAFYAALQSAAQQGDPAAAEQVTRLAMQESIRLLGGT
jgi:GntR family negative regulator for fad regulon and positive regulator of fabA